MPVLGLKHDAVIRWHLHRQHGKYTHKLRSGHSASAVGSSPSSGDVDRTEYVLLWPTAGGSPDCVFVDIDAEVNDSHGAPTDIRRRTTDTDGRVGDGLCEAEQGGQRRPILLSEAGGSHTSWTADQRRRHWVEDNIARCLQEHGAAQPGWHVASQAPTSRQLKLVQQRVEDDRLWVSGQRTYQTVRRWWSPV